MAKQTIITLVDDISGESIDDGAGRTVTFAIDGAQYEIDLSTAHIEELQAAVQPYISAGRRVSSSRRQTSSAPRRSGRASQDLQAIRDWANANGYTVASRGRIPADVLDAYRAR